jgi:hypothetical protein
MLRSNTKHKHLLVLLLSLFLLNQQSFCLSKPVINDSSAREMRLLDEEKKSELFGNSDYRYDNSGQVPGSPWERFKDWLNRKFSEIFNSKEGDIGFKILEYALIIAAIVIIILLLLRNNIRALFYGKSAAVPLDFSELKENIHAINFDTLIAESISKKDYRKAIRLHFLKILKDLSDRSLIEWRIDKTNYDYSIELKKTHFSEPFNELALLYDRVWYGDIHIDKERYDMLMPKFKTNRFR